MAPSPENRTWDSSVTARNFATILRGLLVSRAGVEPTRTCVHGSLSPTRLPFRIWTGRSGRIWIHNSGSEGRRFRPSWNYAPSFFGDPLEISTRVFRVKGGGTKADYTNGPYPLPTLLIEVKFATLLFSPPSLKKDEKVKEWVKY